MGIAIGRHPGQRVLGAPIPGIPQNPGGIAADAGLGAEEAFDAARVLLDRGADARLAAKALEKMRAALKRHTIEVNDNGFLPEGSALEGYEASRVPGA